jgi:carbamoyl-phosphate synthase small subunit
MSEFGKIIADENINAVIVLSDGACFFGKGIGCKGSVLGEICFNTSMTGYQEILTDPSYSGQLITFTFPHIGNVGCNSADFESKQVYCNGLIIKNTITQDSNCRSEGNFNDWLIRNSLTGISEVDTRALTRNIREKGARVAVICYVEAGQELDTVHLLQQAKDFPTLDGMELAEKVTTDKTYCWNEKSFKMGQSNYETISASNVIHKIVVMDFGVKKNILRSLCDVGLDLIVVNAKASFDEILSHHPDGVFLSNGPGDPFATAKYAVPVIKKLLDVNMPIFGICLGHQLLSIASGLSTVKMEHGHRGANHPVANIANKIVEITSQNHGFCVSDKNIPDEVEITHISLFDNTIEGIKRKDKAAFSVQYHPESSPGPHDSRYLFEEFVKMIAMSKVKAAS